MLYFNFKMHQNPFSNWVLPARCIPWGSYSTFSDPSCQLDLRGRGSREEEKEKKGRGGEKQGDERRGGMMIPHQQFLDLPLNIEYLCSNQNQ